jgi:two-component system chemotaxis sensor kinase CheA
MHLVRNAVDHGIEAVGEVVMVARREKDLVLVEVSDNGRGIDPGALRRQAVARGLLGATQAEQLSDRDALMLICLPGLSTAREVTETSGRGVGMDVVKSAVEKLGGSLDIHSAPGRGTRFQLRLPLSMAIIKILLVSQGGLQVALPLTRVRRTLELPAAAVLEGAEGCRAFWLDEEEVALVDFGQLLGGAAAPARNLLSLVLVETSGTPVAIEVDGFLGQRDAFVKEIGFPLNCLTGISGATIAGDGSVVFIIDPHPLLEGGPVPLPGGQTGVWR